MKVAERNQLHGLWQQRLKYWQKSGLKQVEWCRQQQLKSAQLLETQTVEYIDMRKPIDGLAALIEQETKLNPFDAQLFVF